MQGKFRSRLVEAANQNQPILIKGVHFRDGLDLSDFHTDKPVEFDECRFDKTLLLSRCQFQAGFKFIKCRVRGGIDFDDAKVESECIFDRSILRVASGKSYMALTCERLEVVGRLAFREVHVRGNLNMTSLRVTDEIGFFQNRIRLIQNQIAVHQNDWAINLRSSRLGKSVYFANLSNKFTAVIRGQVNLYDSVIEGALRFQEVKIGIKGGVSIDLENAEIKRFVNFDPKTLIYGKVNLQTKVGGQVRISGVEIGEAGGTSVDMDGAEIGGSIFFQDKARINGEINLRAKVGGQVNFSNVTVGSGKGRAVNMESAKFSGSVYFRMGCVLRGGLNLRNASLGDGFYGAGDIDRSRFDPPVAIQDYRSGNQIDAIRLRKELYVGGEITLDFAKIVGPLLLHRASVWGTITARHLVVRGDLQLCASVAGPRDDDAGPGWRVLLAAARELSAGELGQERRRYRRDHFWHNYWLKAETERPAAEAAETVLNLEMAKVEGRLWLKSSRLLGGVTLEDARVDGELNCSGAAVCGDLRLRSARVSGRVFGDEKPEEGSAYPRVKGVLDARGAALSEVEVRYAGDAKNPAAVVAKRGDPVNGPRAVLLDDATVRTLKVTGRLPGGDGPGPNAVFHLHQLAFDEIDVSDLEPPKAAGGSVWRRLFDLRYDPTLRRYRERDPADRRRLLVAAYAVVLVGLFAAHWSLPGVKLALGAIGVAGFVMLLAGGGDRRRMNRGRVELNLRRQRLGALLDHTAMSPQFYLSVEQAKRAEGDDRLADDVFLRRRRRELEELRPLGEPREPGYSSRGPRPGLGLAARSWYRLIDFSVGYGVRPHRVVSLFLMLWLLNWGVFLNPRSVERPLSFGVPPEVQAERREAWADGYPQAEGGANPWPADGGVPAAGEWHAGHAFFVAMRVQLPLLSLLAEGDWEPSSRPMRVFDEALGGAWGAEGGPEGVLTFENYASVMQVTNLILIPLMIAGATGVLKRRETLGS